MTANAAKVRRRRMMRMVAALIMGAPYKGMGARRQGTMAPRRFGPRLPVGKSEVSEQGPPGEYPSVSPSRWTQACMIA
jgi:hypothetical protein